MEKKFKSKVMAALFSAAFLAVGGGMATTYAYTDTAAHTETQKANVHYSNDALTIKLPEMKGDYTKYQSEHVTLDKDGSLTVSSLATQKELDVINPILKSIMDGELVIEADGTIGLNDLKDESVKTAAKNNSGVALFKADEFKAADSGDNASVSVMNSLQSVSKGSSKGSSSSKASSANVDDILGLFADASSSNATTSTDTSASAGTITATDSITAGGTIQTNTLNAASVEAVTGTITGNQNVNGTFTAGGVAHLNGGAALNNQKITGLADGEVSATSTDAVNGKQLYNAMQNAGKTYTAGSDITISSANAISVNKTGQVASGNTGIVTGGEVYKSTSKLNATATDQGNSISAQTTKIASLSSTIESLRKTLGDINTSVSSTISDLPSSLNNFVNKDLTNLSADGQNTIKTMIRNEIKNQLSSTKSTSTTATTQEVSYASQPVAVTANDTTTVDKDYVDKAVAGKADQADLDKLSKVVDTKADKADLDALSEKVDTKADKTYVDSELAKKADKSTVDAIAKNVEANTKNIASNTEAIKTNAEGIKNLQETKANKDASNIDVKAWSEKLGTGVIEKDNTGLVTGGTVFNALEGKADKEYVDSGFKSMQKRIDDMGQALTDDINRVGAGAAALAGLHPQEYNPNNKLDFAIGYGHYRSANAAALGVYYRPNSVTTISLAGTVGNGDPMLSAGLSFKLGMGKNVEKVIVSKEEYDNMKAHMNEQAERIKRMEQAIQTLSQK